MTKVEIIQKALEDKKATNIEVLVDAQLFLVIVHKTQFVDPQPLCFLGNAFCQEHGAHTASAKYRDLHRTPPVFPRARAKFPIL